MHSYSHRFDNINHSKTELPIISKFNEQNISLNDNFGLIDHAPKLKDLIDDINKKIDFSKLNGGNNDYSINDIGFNIPNILTCFMGNYLDAQLFDVLDKVDISETIFDRSCDHYSTNCKCFTINMDTDNKYVKKTVKFLSETFNEIKKVHKKSKKLDNVMVNFSPFLFNYIYEMLKMSNKIIANYDSFLDELKRSIFTRIDDDDFLDFFDNIHDLEHFINVLRIDKNVNDIYDITYKKPDSHGEKMYIIVLNRFTDYFDIKIVDRLNKREPKILKDFEDCENEIYKRVIGTEFEIWQRVYMLIDYAIAHIFYTNIVHGVYTDHMVFLNMIKDHIFGSIIKCITFEKINKTILKHNYDFDMFKIKDELAKQQNEILHLKNMLNDVVKQ